MLWCLIASVSARLSVPSTLNTLRGRWNRRHISTVSPTSSRAFSTRPRAPFAQHGTTILLHLLFHEHPFSQFCYLASACSAILHFFAIDHRPWVPRIFSLPHLVFPTEVGARYVEGVNVGGENGAEEEHAIDEEVIVGSAEQSDARGWEEDVDYPQSPAFENHFD
jgi:hypothetical protein